MTDVYTAIATKMEQVFDNPVIFFDALPQTFNGPCFWVRLLDAVHEHKLNNRYELTLNFDVMCYPGNEQEPTAELNDVAFKLMFGIEYIQVVSDKPSRGTNISYEIQEGVLHFFITYKFFIEIPHDRGVLMQKLYQLYKYKE